MKNVIIKFEKTNEEAKLPFKKRESDTGWDVFSVENKIIPARGSAVVDIGLNLAYITPGYWLQVGTRSGMGFKYGLMCHPGVIDNCVPAGTLIKTVNGDIPVEQLYSQTELPYVISYNTETLQNEVDKITDFWIVNNVELIEIETEFNKVKIPPEKEVYTKRGWIKAKNLTLDDEILEF